MKDMDISELETLIKDSIRGVVPAAKDPIQEAYVATAKNYSQVTDYVSNKTKQNHETLYKAYTEQLTKVSAQVDSASQDLEAANSSSSNLRSFKRDEAYLLNAVYLHELFFANCFAPNSELMKDMLTFTRVSQDWGDFERWTTEFRALCQTSRNGWVVLGYSTFLKRLLNVVVDGHDIGFPVGFIPVLVVDMWEHSYTADYAGDKPSYVNAMLREVNWDVVEERMEKLDAVKKVMK